MATLLSPAPRPPYQQPLPPHHQPPSPGWFPSALGRMEAASSNQQAPPSLDWHYGELDDRNFQAHGRSLVLVIVVFSIVLFVTLLCLYARWACRYRRTVITVSSSSAVGADGMEGGGGVYAVAVGLDREAIDGMPVILFEETATGRRTEETAVRCSICLSTYRDGDKVKVLPGCGHMFHPECVDEWLRAQPTCPLCRSTLGVRGQEQQLGEAAV